MFDDRPDMAEVSPGLFIGSAPRRRQRKALARLGVDVVVDLGSERPEPDAWPVEIEVVQMPLADGQAPDAEMVRQLTTWITDRISVGQRVLVHCQDGAGRSAADVCAVLVGMGWSLGDAYRTLCARRPEVAPTNAQLVQLTSFERELTAQRG